MLLGPVKKPLARGWFQWLTTVVNQWSTSLSSSANGQPLVTCLQCKSTLKAQYGCLIFLLTCEIRLQLSKFFCYSKHKNLLTVKQRYELGPWSWLVTLRLQFGWNSRITAVQPNTRERSNNYQRPNMFLVGVAKMHTNMEWVWKWRDWENGGPSNRLVILWSHWSVNWICFDNRWEAKWV